MQPVHVLPHKENLCGLDKIASNGRFGQKMLTAKDGVINSMVTGAPPKQPSRESKHEPQSTPAPRQAGAYPRL